MKQDNRIKVNKGTKIRNRYNQVQHLTQDTNGKVTNAQLDTTNERQEVSPFPAGDHKAAMNRPQSMTNTRHNNTNDPQIKEVLPGFQDFGDDNSVSDIFSDYLGRDSRKPVFGVLPQSLKMLNLADYSRFSDIITVNLLRSAVAQW